MDEFTTHLSYKVWLDIEEYDERTGSGTEMDAPGAELATFATFERAWDYAARLTRLAEGINV
jgi:hypothetical protein